MCARYLFPSDIRAADYFGFNLKCLEMRTNKNSRVELVSSTGLCGLILLRFIADVSPGPGGW
jgi:hypothetical protein